MRRLWLLPALVMAFTTAPYVAQDPGDPTPEATTEEVPLTDAPDEVVEPGWGVQVTTDTDLVGITWEGDPGARFTVEARDESGEWTPAFVTRPLDGGPDPGTDEAARVETLQGDSNVSEPVWLGDATAVRVRLADDAGEPVTGVELTDVESPEATAPEGSAGAVPPQPGIRSRASWGAAPQRAGCSGIAGTITRAIVHHTDGTNNYSDTAAVLRGIQQYHFNRGWCDIGYNFLVDKWGTVWEGRGGGITKAVIGAHSEGSNTGSTGIALIGNHVSTPVSSAARLGLRSILAWKLGLHDVVVKSSSIIGHRNVYSTACPGNRAYAMLPALRNEVAFIVAVYAPRYKALEERPGGGWYQLDGTGTVDAVFAPHYGEHDFNWDIARDIAVMPDGKGYIVLDGYGGLWKFGSANQGTMKNLRGPYWNGWDIARDVAITPNGKGLVVLDAWGGLHPRGNAPVVAGSYWPGWDIAKDVEFDDDFGVYILDGLGGIRQRNGASNFGADYWPGWDLAEDLTVKGDGSGYASLDAWGGIHPRGNMPGGNLGWKPVDQWRGLFYSESGHYYLGLKHDGSGATG
ncbi:MAG: N-acetylmuramoyl-L-alanine amidase [Acidimicrobiia bacterium]